MTHAVLAEHVHVSVRKNCSACRVRTQCGATFFTRQLNFVAFDVRVQGEMDGVEVAQEIKRLRDIPIIFITADTDEATVQRAIAAEPDGFLIKPFDELELIAAIDVAIKKHQRERQARANERRIRELTDS